MPHTFSFLPQYQKSQKQTNKNPKNNPKGHCMWNASGTLVCNTQNYYTWAGHYEKALQSWGEGSVSKMGLVYMCTHAGAHTNTHKHMQSLYWALCTKELTLSSCTWYISWPGHTSLSKTKGDLSRAAKCLCTGNNYCLSPVAGPTAWCSQVHSCAWLSPNITHVRFVYSACSCALSMLSVWANRCASIPRFLTHASVLLAQRWFK